MVKLALVILLGSAAAAHAFSADPSLARLKCAECADVERERQRFSDEEWAELADGEVLVREETAEGAAKDEQRHAEAFAIVPRPPQLVWDVLLDVDSRPSFMPSMRAARVTRAESDRIHVTQELKILWETIEYSVINTVDPARGRIDWALDKTAANDIAESEGTWQVVPLAKGRRTLLKYRSYTDTGRPVPALLESYLTKRSLPKMMEALRDETLRRDKAGIYPASAVGRDRSDHEDESDGSDER